ncbi:MAG TPA: class I SAM-dependent methyltransferase [Longimicrobiales bacterium]
MNGPLRGHASGLGGGYDAWAEADAYEPYVGRWSRLVATRFLDWIDADAGLDWLDAGCGTGALAHAITRESAPRRVAGIDRSAAYAAAARAQAPDGRAAFAVGDAAALPLRTGCVDVAVSGLVLNFVPDPAAMVGELARVVRSGGTVALYVWDYAEGMELMRHLWDAAVELDPAAAGLDEGRRFPICAPQPLRLLFVDAGLSDVDARAIDVPTVFRDFDDFWRPFLGGQGPAPGYVMSLDEDRRAALREAVRGRLPAAPDGTIRLQARVWAAKGRVQ